MALSIGVRAQEFWELNPRRLMPYIKGHQLLARRQAEEANFQSWLLGIYVTHALGCAFSETAQYPEEPFDLFGEKISPEERSKQEAAVFCAYVEEFNKQQRKEDQ